MGMGSHRGVPFSELSVLMSTPSSEKDSPLWLAGPVKIVPQFFNPIIPGVQKPYSARGGASEAPRVKSQHSGLPDDPMPYNGNYILCLGIN